MNYSRLARLATFLFITSSAAQVPPPPPPMNPSTAFPRILEGAASVVPLDAFPAEGRAFVGHQNEVFLNSRKVSSRGTTFREIAATEGEVKSHAVLFSAVMASDAKKSTTRQLKGLPEGSEWEAVGSKMDSPTGKAEMSRSIKTYKAVGRSMYVRAWDMRQDGGGVVQIADFVTGSVNGSPATLVVRTHVSAGALWTLNWASDGVDYELGLHEPTLDTQTADQMIKIAESLR